MFKKFAAIASVTTLIGTTAFSEPLPVNDYLNVTPTDAPFSISLGVTFAKTENNYMYPYYLDSTMMSEPQIETISMSVATGASSAVSNATASMNGSQGLTSSNGGGTSGAALNSSVVQTINGGFESTVGAPAAQPPLLSSMRVPRDKMMPSTEPTNIIYGR